MHFLISDTFTDSLTRLTGEEQKSVKTTAFDLQMNPSNPGHSFHKLGKGKDKNFWSVRVNSDIRLIVHKTSGSLMLCYVDHHDKAYGWAERRRLETHPKTGAAQLVEVRETVQEIFLPLYAEPAPLAAKPIFDRVGDDDLLAYGVPADWLADVRQVRDEDGLLALAMRLPAEAGEALLDLATGGAPGAGKAAEPVATTTTTTPVYPPVVDTESLLHPDAQRRFRVLENHEELEQALAYPWEKWTIFLHPEQRQWVEKEYNGPARVSGSAGTGKTIVALHRAVRLAKSHPECRILLATYSETLAVELRVKLRRLLGDSPRLAERIDVFSLPGLGLRLHRSMIGPVKLVESGDLRRRILESAVQVQGQRFSEHFLLSEWDHVVDAWQIGDWEGYRDVARLGRRTRLPENQRTQLWAIFSKVRESLDHDGLSTEAAIFTRLAEALGKADHPPYEFAVVDESQDLGVAHLRFFAALGKFRPDTLFFAGDSGQRIFQQPFSWKSLGVDIRGRSRTLRVNYRTSQQIRRRADRLLGPESSDADGNTERRDTTISVFQGPAPVVRAYADEEAEAEAVAAWLNDACSRGGNAREVGLFVRSDAQFPRAIAALDRAGLPYRILDQSAEALPGQVVVGTMHTAKGLEFRAVAIMACDDEILPLQERIETVGDGADLQEVYETERHLLYVACTRAREELLITSVDPASEFLDDMGPKD
jgi:superfamily I DNA/RNA helicase/mRNA-degrading endonuclease RelE of RelBE toxin-antitoxin system